MANMFPSNLVSANFHPPHDSYQSEGVKAITCFLADIWSKQPSSFRTCCAISRGCSPLRGKCYLQHGWAHRHPWLVSDWQSVCYHFHPLSTSNFSLFSWMMLGFLPREETVASSGFELGLDDTTNYFLLFHSGTCVNKLEIENWDNRESELKMNRGQNRN